MDRELFKALLDVLQPTTLAGVVVDLEEAQEEWRHFPEEAPLEATRQGLAQTLALIVKLGTARAEADDLDFHQMIEQIRDERRQGDWPWQRDQQERENWLKDYE